MGRNMQSPENETVFISKMEGRSVWLTGQEGPDEIIPGLSSQ